jgi:hypothetical protein
MTSGAEAWLVDDRWGKAYPLTTETTIGRGPQCAIILRDPAVSRLHAIVRRKGIADVLILSENATGTKLNGDPVTTDIPLREGDVIDIALTSLRYTTQAPTGEMFVVSRDYPIAADKVEPPTRPTLHAMHPITLASRARTHRWWYVGAALLLVVAVLALCAPNR